MSFLIRTLFILVALSGPMMATPAEKAKPAAPTQDAIQSLYDRGLYPETLKALAQALSLRSEAAREYDRHALLLLKFQTHLRMKSLTPAFAALRAAADETDDPQAQAMSAALKALFDRSRNFTFTARPQGKDDPPLTFDLIDPDKRFVALETFVAAEMAAAEETVDEAARSRSVPSMAQAMKLVQKVRVYELAVTDGGKRSDQMQKLLSTRGHELMKQNLARLIRRIETLDQNADQIIRRRKAVPGRGRIRVYRPTVDDGRRRGLTSAERAELRRIIRQAPNVHATVIESATALRLSEDDAEALLDQTEDLRRLAERTLEDEMEQ